MSYTILCYSIYINYDEIVIYRDYMEDSVKNMAGVPTKTVICDGEGEIIEKKSRFIGNLYKIESEEQVSTLIAALKKKYWDARHHCYAFVLGDNNENVRSSDDGEPSGTAGKPIMEALVGSGIRNCLIVVTRYFGGTLLGTGGLVRAYSQAAKAAIDGSEIAECTQGTGFLVKVDYTDYGKIQYIAAQENALVANVDYADNVIATIYVEKYNYDAIYKQISDQTAGRAQIEVLEDCVIGIDREQNKLFKLE